MLGSSGICIGSRSFFFSLYMFPLGSISKKCGLSLHCYADDTHVYLPLKWNSDRLDTLVACLSDVKAWVSLDFLNFNESKMEIIVFGPSDSLYTPKINLSGLSTCLKTFLSFINFEKVIHAFISARLDYCYSLLVGISQSALSRLQLVQNVSTL